LPNRPPVTLFKEITKSCRMALFPERGPMVLFFHKKKDPLFRVGLPYQGTSLSLIRTQACNPRTTLDP
jgi:hypothetical protein